MHLSKQVPKPSTQMLLIVRLLILALVTLGSVAPSIASDHGSAELAIGESAKTYLAASDIDHSFWHDALEQELISLETAPTVYRPEVQSYLDALVGRLASKNAEAVSQGIRYRVRIVRDASPVSFAYPHGTIVLSTGLLAEIDNETQLAAVVAHEMTHIEKAHLARLASSDPQGAREKALAWSTGTEVPSDLELESLFGLMAQVEAADYGRELEAEAHLGVVSKLRAQGYDLREASRLYQRLEEDHSSFHAHAADFRRVASAVVTEIPLRVRAPLVTAHQFTEMMRPMISDLASLSLPE